LSLLADRDRILNGQTYRGGTAMTAKPKDREPRSRKPSSSNDIAEPIRQRAHELYEQRGRIDGFALDDWLQAEGEILGAQKRKAKATRGSQC
jgi:hypothetical protein